MNLPLVELYGGVAFPIQPHGAPLIDEGLAGIVPPVERGLFIGVVWLPEPAAEVISPVDRVAQDKADVKRVAVHRKGFY